MKQTICLSRAIACAGIEVRLYILEKIHRAFAHGGFVLRVIEIRATCCIMSRLALSVAGAQVKLYSAPVPGNLCSDLLGISTV